MLENSEMCGFESCLMIFHCSVLDVHYCLFLHICVYMYSVIGGLITPVGSFILS